MLRTFNFEKTPVVELVNDILVDAAKRGASDIHFDPQNDYLKARIRIDGELIDYAEIPMTIARNLITRVKIISGMNITESRLPQDGAIRAKLEGLDLDLRVSALPTNKGEKIVIRILDYSLSLAGLENLGFNQENYKKVMKMISAPNGIILVTGATGTGKSTTVYSLLQKLNKENTNIISVEDPIEMDIDGINQIQTNSEIGLDFATVLRSILRQDPNIIMIGEIRDTETAKIAVRASITGHLVLSTLHTNDSLNTIERLLDMDVERYLLASALTGIISQKLARKLCPHCRKLRPTNDYEKGIIKKVTGKEVNEIYTAVGCDECKNGYNGRIAIHEVLLINQEIKDAISSNVKKEKLRHLVYNSDVISLLQDGINKVLDGETTLEELLKIIELEDDDTTESTGLENAIEVNELTKEEKTEEVKEKPIIETKNDDSISTTPTVNQKSFEVNDMLNQENNESIVQEQTIKPEPVLDNSTIDEDYQLPEEEIKHEVDIELNDNQPIEKETELEINENNKSFKGSSSKFFSTKKRIFK